MLQPKGIRYGENEQDSFSEWGKKQDSSVCCLKGSHFRLKAIQSEGMEKILHANRSNNKALAAMLISDKIDFKTKNVKRNKDIT